MIKIITPAVLYFSVALSITYILADSIGVSNAMALVEPVVNTVVLYFHEKAWNRYEKNKSEKQKLWVSLHQCGQSFRRPFARLKPIMPLWFGHRRKNAKP